MTNSKEAVESRKKTNEIAIVLVVVVAVVVAIIAVAYVGLSAIKDVATSDVEITVLSSGEPADYIFPPGLGEKYVDVSFSFENNGDHSRLLSYIDFELEVEGGLRYAVTWNVEVALPASIAPGGSGTFSVAFEVPENAIPHYLVYKPLFDPEIKAVIP